MDSDESRPLPNRPEAKMPPLPKGFSPLSSSSSHPPIPSDDHDDDGTAPLPNRPEAKMPPLPKGFSPLSSSSSRPPIPSDDHDNDDDGTASANALYSTTWSFSGLDIAPSSFAFQNSHLTPSARAPGSHIHKRPLPAAPFSLRQLRDEQNQATFRGPGQSSSAKPNYDPDGYLPPPRAPHTVIIKVAASAPFMSIVKRVRKALENGPQKTAGLPLTARIAALEVYKDEKAQEENMGPISDALDDVVMVGTGRAIQKVVELGCFFAREKDLLIVTRTRTLTAIDDVELDDDEVDVMDGVRTRNVSCIEVGIRWA